MWTSTTVGMSSTPSEASKAEFTLEPFASTMMAVRVIFLPHFYTTKNPIADTVTLAQNTFAGFLFRAEAHTFVSIVGGFYILSLQANLWSVDKA